MNLYLRARMEQEVDVVLEVKLARRSRPQFIADSVSSLLITQSLSTYSLFILLYEDLICEYTSEKLHYLLNI